MEMTTDHVTPHLSFSQQRVSSNDNASNHGYSGFYNNESYDLYLYTYYLPMHHYPGWMVHASHSDQFSSPEPMMQLDQLN